MSQAFIEVPDQISWNPIPGANHSVRDAHGGFAQVVKVYPIPAITRTFHLMVSPLREVLRVEVINECPMLHMSEALCGAISIAQYSVILNSPDACRSPDFVLAFSAYDYEFALLGRRSTIVASTPEAIPQASRIPPAGLPAHGIHHRFGMAGT